MIGEITNHLWQSTVFAIVAALLALAFRKNRAEVRYWLWLSASLKFLIPFSLLIGVGIRAWDALAAGKIATHVAAPSVSAAMVEITQPFPETFGYVSAAPHTTNWIPIAILTLWAFGFFCVALIRCRSWFRIRAAVRASAPLNINATIPVRSSATLLEPGVVGFLRPVLLLPEGILKQLTPPQLEAVLAHEQCHVRRRDDLTSAFHMIVEAIFWFHPAAWWIGAKLVEERERACDEAVLKLGNEAQVYAEGILNVCKSYLESPLRCVSGVTGSDLESRIRAILTERVAGDLNFTRKVALAVVGTVALAVPICIGVVGAPSIRAQSNSEYKFEVASVKVEKSPSFSGALPVVRVNPAPDGFTASGVNLLQLISIAYGPPGSLLGAFNRDQLYFQNDPISHAPDWFRTERYDVDARMETSVADALQKLSPDERNLARQHMLQALLQDRFKLTVHHETKELPVFALVIAKDGSKLHEAADDATASAGGGRGGAGSFQLKGRGGPIVAQGVPISTLVYFLSRQPLGRSVMDKTGLAGKYDFTLQWTPDDLQTTASDDTAPLDSPWPSLFTAVQEQLGLKLEPQKGPVQTLVIDHVEKPSGN